jgi:(p)ppGpp synthase/HD superfamily hydrolase
MENLYKIKRSPGINDSSNGNIENYDFDLKNKLLSNLEKFDLMNSPEINLAMSTALEIHADQKPRPDGPYVNHIMRVTNRLMEEYGISDPDIIIGAFLHDSVEDQVGKIASKKTPPWDIQNQTSRDRAFSYINDTFGERVEKIVKKLSNPEPETEGLSVEQKNEIYKKHVKEIIEDSDVLPIKLSDFSDNALNLEAVSDVTRRLKLSKKYLPVMHVFIERLNSANDIMSEDKINEMKLRLKDAVTNTDNFIKINS